MTLTAILQLAIALSALILVHELGHFLAARLFKVEVQEFGLGYPPRALTLFEHNGTKYTLNWLPLGGFVRLKGEIDEDIEEGSLQAAGPWARLAIFAAGPLMNLLAAVLLYAAIFVQADAPDFSKVLIAAVAPGSPAEAAGLLPGDIVTAVNGEPINSTNELHDLIYAHLGEPIELTYLRDGETVQVSLTPRRNPPPNEGAIGIAMSNPLRPVTWAEALPIGVRTTYESAVFLLSIPSEIARGAIAPEAARPVGIKGMVDALEYVNKQESPVENAPINVNVLGFFAWISVTLGVVNLLPIPALDGGRILFVLPEIVFRRRVPLKWQSIIITISFTALIILMIYINLLDFIDPMRLPQ